MQPLLYGSFLANVIWCNSHSILQNVANWNVASAKKMTFINSTYSKDVREDGRAQNRDSIEERFEEVNKESAVLINEWKELFRYLNLEQAPYQMNLPKGVTVICTNTLKIVTNLSLHWLFRLLICQFNMIYWKWSTKLANINKDILMYGF